VAQIRATGDRRLAAYSRNLPPFRRTISMITKNTQKSTSLVPARAGRGGQEELPSVLHPVLDEMTKSFEKIDSLAHKAGYELMEAWYGMGLLTAKVQSHENKYGQHATARLAAELSARRGRRCIPTS
jgi:hypothetical protein